MTGVQTCALPICTEEDYSILKKPVATIVSKILDNIKSEYIPHTIVAAQIEFSDPEFRKKEFNFFSPLAIASFSFMGFIILLCIISCFIKDPSKSETDVSLCKRIIKCFDISKNFMAIFKITDNEPDLKVLNGIRVLSMLWVILGHTFFHAKSSYVSNIMDIKDFMQTFWYCYILNASYSVDVFFFMSGFLVA